MDPHPAHGSKSIYPTKYKIKKNKQKTKQKKCTWLSVIDPKKIWERVSIGFENVIIYHNSSSPPTLLQQKHDQHHHRHHQTHPLPDPQSREQPAVLLEHPWRNLTNPSACDVTMTREVFYKLYASSPLFSCSHSVFFSSLACAYSLLHTDARGSMRGGRIAVV